MSLTTKGGRELTLRAVGEGWTLESPDEIEKLTVSDAIAVAERWSTKGWVVGQTRRLISSLADSVARRAASVLDGNRMGEAEMRQTAGAILRLIDEAETANLDWYADDS